MTENDLIALLGDSEDALLSLLVKASASKALDWFTINLVETGEELRCKMATTLFLYPPCTTKKISLKKTYPNPNLRLTEFL